MWYAASYPLAVALCVLTMCCWGSFANTQKLTGKNWRYELFYWDYVIGVVLFALAFGLTAGNFGAHPDWGFIANLKAAFGSPEGQKSLAYAFAGGAIFNAANILLACGISIAGLSVAFPVGIGLALVMGVIVNYILKPAGNPLLLFGGITVVSVAIVCNALAYRVKQAAAGDQTSKSRLVKGIVVSVICGILMSFWSPVTNKAIDLNFAQHAKPAVGLLTPYVANFVFALGVLASNFLFNTYMMRRPVEGEPVSYGAYFKGSPVTHLVGILGGVIWGIGTGINLVAGGTAGPAIAYGLGQGATLVSALWGILVWREFAGAPKQSHILNTLMFIIFVTGLALVVLAGN